VSRPDRTIGNMISPYSIAGDAEGANYKPNIERMRPSDDAHFIPMTSVRAGRGEEAAQGVFYFTNQIVNVVMVRSLYHKEWVLIDTGMPGGAATIKHHAANWFGKHSRPAAIILTHGHFDHTGSIVSLLKDWEVPVFAHPLEFPFLTGKQDYPAPDSSVDGGLLAKLAGIYPYHSLDISEYLQPLPDNHKVPFLPEWEWIHVPGHSPGQAAFFRPRDRVLVSGDAVITVRQDKLLDVLFQKTEVNGPPRYLTTDWEAAKDSANKILDLEPAIMVPGHGKAMEGAPLQQGLEKLVKDFQELAVPTHGKYVTNNE